MQFFFSGVILYFAILILILRGTSNTYWHKMQNNSKLSHNFIQVDTVLGPLLTSELEDSGRRHWGFQTQHQEGERDLVSDFWLLHRELDNKNT